MGHDAVARLSTTTHHAASVFSFPLCPSVRPLKSSLGLSGGQTEQSCLPIGRPDVPTALPPARLPAVAAAVEAESSVRSAGLVHRSLSPCLAADVVPQSRGG